MAAATILSAHIIAELKALDGRAKVTYNGSTDFPTVERIRKALQSEVLQTYGEADQEYPTALLVDQRLIESGNTYSLIYVRWETLPGQWLPFTRYDDNLGPVQGRRRPVVNTGQAASLTATTKTTYETKDGSSYVSWEIEESWSDGTASDDENPAYPVLYSDFYDNERGPVQVATQVVVRTGSEAGSFSSAVTKISYSPGPNRFLLSKATETWSLPGPLRTTDIYDNERGDVQQTKQLVAASSVSGTLARSGSVVTETKYTEWNFYILEKTIETWSLPGPLLTSVSINEKGETVTTTRQAVTEVTAPAADSLLTLKSEVDAKSAVQSSKTTATIDAHAPTVITQAFDDAQGKVGTETRSTVAPATAVPAETDLILSAKMVAISATKGELTVRQVEEQPITYSYAQEEETRLWLKTSAQIVPATTITPPAAVVVGQEIRYKSLGTARAMKTITTFNAGAMPGNRQETVEVDYTYPALLLDIDFVMLAAIDGSGEFKIGTYPTLRSGFKRKVNGTLAISYHATEPSPTAATIIEPVDIYANGIFVRYTIPNVLCNAYTSSSFTTGSSNPKWPPFVETTVIPVSTPSLTAYIALTDLVLSCKIKEWKLGIWRKEVLSIPAL